MTQRNAALHPTRRAALGLGLAALAAPALAQPFPSRPIRLLVPFPPGGSTDIYARILAAKLSDRMGQPVLVENRPGGGGGIATAATVRAEADGHTLLYHTGSLTILPAMVANLGFDARRDLAPVSLLYEAPLLIIAGKDFAPRTVQDLMAAAKARPGALNLAHSGNGTTNHLAAAQFMRAAGVEMVLVPYAGNAGVLNAMLRGEVGVAFDTIATSAAFVREGNIRPMAVTSAQRSPAMPDVPTLAESGLPGFDAVFWNGVFAPAATPPEVIARLNAEIDAVLRLPEVIERIRELGSLPAGGAPAVMARRFAADYETWGNVIRAGNLRAE